MRYHCYFFDTFGEPYCSTQSDDEIKAIEMLTKHAQRSNRVPKLVMKARFLVSVDDMVIVMAESFV